MGGVCYGYSQQDSQPEGVGLGRRGGAEAPGPAPSWLFVCRRGAGFPPSVSVCACLPFVSGGLLSGSDCTLPETECLSPLFPVRVCEVAGSYAPWCVELTALTWAGSGSHTSRHVSAGLGCLGGRFDFEVPYGGCGKLSPPIPPPQILVQGPPQRGGSVRE